MSPTLSFSLKFSTLPFEMLRNCCWSKAFHVHLDVGEEGPWVIVSEVKLLLNKIKKK